VTIDIGRARDATSHITKYNVRGVVAGDGKPGRIHQSQVAPYVLSY
jgi:hypothetical protein